MEYTPVNWKESPNTTTPINAANLNHMEAGISGNAEDIKELERSKNVTINMLLECVSQLTLMRSNIIAFPYDQALVNGKYTANNVEFTVQSDGGIHITTNGLKSTATTNFNLQYRNSTITPLNLAIGHKLNLSGGRSNCIIWINSANNVNLLKDTGTGFSYTPDQDYKLCSAFVQVPANVTIDDVVIYPMLTYSSDDSYVEYAKCIEGVINRFNELFPVGAKVLKNIVYSKTVSIPATGASAAFEFTMPAGATARIVNIKESWPVNSWANGAVANIVRWEQVGTTLKVSFSTTQAQNYNVTISVLYD